MASAAEELREDHLSVRVQSGGMELVERIADAWRDLCDEAGDNEVFYRPEWALAYFQAFHPKADVVVLSAWRGAQLRGVLPLVRHRVKAYGLPIIKLAVPGNVYSFRAGLTICAGEEGNEVLRELWQSVQKLPQWDVIDIDNVVEGSGLDRLRELALVNGYAAARKRISQTLYLTIGKPVDEKPANQTPWLAETRPKFRSHLRRSKKQLEEQGALACKHFAAADPAALEKFYALEGSGWKGAEGTAIRCDEKVQRFYTLVAQAAANAGYLSLDFLELNGKPIAAHFGFNLRGRYFLAKAGYDESFRRQGPGQLLVNEILSETPKRGLHEFDFVGPATWDESRWASQRRTNYRIFIFRKSWYGKLLHALRISAWGAVQKLRGRQEDESAPLELRAKPQGSEKDKDAADS